MPRVWSWDLACLCLERGRRRGPCRSHSETEARLCHQQEQEGRECLDQAGDVAVAGLVQVQGAEDVVEEGWMVPAGSLAVRVEVHLQDLWLHHSLPIWTGVPLQHEVDGIHGPG